MIPLDLFYKIYAQNRPAPDTEQRKVIEQVPGQPLFIVAGPGTGKTTCLTLRILKLVLVDGVPPKGILATTFTRKAAAELRSRVLGWGFKVIDKLKALPTLTPPQKAFLDVLDINQVWTGTVDSLCEQLLSDFRAPGTQPPVLADEFVSGTLMLREGMFKGQRWQDPQLDALLLDIHSGNGQRFNFHAGTKANLLMQIWDRRFQDQVNWPAFVAAQAPANPAVAMVDAALTDYQNELTAQGMVDFALLENEVLVRLRASQLTDFTDDLQVVLVDEYQDTNLLQEQIYFELASACGGALAVVGDDDQSLYRFRGATVELFSDFPSRYSSRFTAKPQTVYLANNYRSTDPIIHLVNDYATLDPGYQAVRVAKKPPLNGPKKIKGLPILGMFRPTIQDLSVDLSDFIHQVFQGTGYKVPGHGKVERAPAGGDLGDCALLCSSPAEYSATGKERMPHLLRQFLRARTPAIEVFNPRGEDLTEIPDIAQFGGLLLECIDPAGVIQNQTSGLSQEAQAVFTSWRGVALTLVNGPNAPAGLRDYAIGWANRDPNPLNLFKRRHLVWPRTVPVIDLIYGLVHFFPWFHDDPEGQVYLEVFTRQLTAASQVGKFEGGLVYDPNKPGIEDASIKELLRDFLGPIGAGQVSLNEDLMESFPRDRLCILSIHQSKGLEFPLLIVDVGSDFKDRRAAPFKRFPKDGAPAHRLENLLRPYCAMGVPSRSKVNRAFDDLYRQYFVAFSRPQDVLLMVGVSPAAPNGRVENVAAGWTRTNGQPWASPLPYVAI